MPRDIPAGTWLRYRCRRRCARLLWGHPYPAPIADLDPLPGRSTISALTDFLSGFGSTIRSCSKPDARPGS